MLESACGDVLNSFTIWLIDQHIIQITERHNQEQPS